MARGCSDVKNKSGNQPWLESEKLVADIDPKDTHYIAFSNHFRGKIWSGDKVFMNGLSKKGFTNFTQLMSFLSGDRRKKKKDNGSFTGLKQVRLKE